ncbi:hypothetical protein PUNSTDRAFT_65808 [Punctularia strigosozonata HHB-11173 SS5]|uniref:uncharacterized protein n=1 Tax=Punctularia strigosozonata (strain HHB-11173) TaxID=741275 RepID=UPI0004418731|nr:uncharacterized protein PUNSTDRAFT_65808 [Punctularia strigosozonata HHB-11173 SS5]EIN10816.1 hypothetical protein PUNSTDRAFT_65808 [Punctularia strigosozonata HHB-11173 SS5]
MSSKIIVANHVSSLFPPSQAAFVQVETALRNLPLPDEPTDSDPPSEHASYSSVFYNAITGTLISRVLSKGRILELITLAADSRPLRFSFPAPILPAPGIFLWEQCELHILVVTTAGSLYRLVIPVGDDGQLSLEQRAKNWCREYLIRYASSFDGLEGLVHAQGPHSIAIGLQNGSLLRLETDVLGDEMNTDQWTETILQHNSFLNQIASFLHSSAPGTSQVIALASYPQPTDIGHVWSFSRDRTLRLWSAKLGCVSAITLPIAASRAITPAFSTSASSTPPPRPQILLDAAPQNLLRVCSLHDEPRILVFVPTPSSSASAGTFHLLSFAHDVLSLTRIIECSEESAHCRLQDFLVISDTLYVLWDKQGQSFVETSALQIGASWHSAAYPKEAELTPSHLDELLLSPGSLAEKFFKAVMRPGMFSTVTLRTAIDQYTAACCSIPFPLPLQLTTTYTSLGDKIAAVVGCTVKLTRDPQTGLVQYDNYWSALKRDWEGFIARCREIERSARWPLALGISDPTGQGHVVVIERERLGAILVEDQPLWLHRNMSLSMPVGTNPEHNLFEILWILRTKLSRPTLLQIESKVVDFLRQEIAFPFSDIIRDLALRVGFRDDLDEGLETWIGGRLQSIGDMQKIQDAVKAALDYIALFGLAIKREEEEVELILPTTNSEWTRALTSQYAAATVQARYDLGFSLVLLLFLLADELEEWDPALLAEVFGVFRGISMLLHIAKQPSGDGMGDSSRGGASAADDVVSGISHLGLSQRDSFRPKPIYSLMHRLLTQSSDTVDPPSAAHNFLEAIGLLDAGSPAHATRNDVFFCERLRLVGHHYVARELLSWLPRTPGATYVLSRLCLDTGRIDDAASLFHSLAGVFGESSNILSAEDSQALAGVLPGAKLFDSDFSFYLHTASLFKSSSDVEHEVQFYQLAISVAPPEQDTSPLWYAVIHGLIGLALYEDAYASLISTPFEKLKRECVPPLVYKMCEDNAVDTLMTFNFAGIADEVENALAFKARNADPRLRPFYSRILFAWYTLRGDHRNAALAMFQRARKLSDALATDSDFMTLSELQLEAYGVAMNSLSLLDEKDAWITLSVPSKIGSERRRLSKYFPESSYSPGTRNVELVTKTDIEYEYALVSARLELVRREPSTIYDGPSVLIRLLPPEAIVMRLSQANRFETAISVARSLKVDMSDIFSRLAGQCLRLGTNPISVTQEDTSDWLLTDKVSSWAGTPVDRGWRFLRLTLERNDGPDTDFAYTKAVLETILAFARTTPLPSWLANVLLEHDSEHLIRTCLRHKNFECALEYSMAVVKRADAQLNRQPPKTAMTTWVPYNLIDQVLAAIESEGSVSTRARTLQQSLKKEISSRLPRLHKLSQFPTRQST